MFNLHFNKRKKEKRTSRYYFINEGGSCARLGCNWPYIYFFRSRQCILLSIYFVYFKHTVYPRKVGWKLTQWIKNKLIYYIYCYFSFKYSYRKTCLSEYLNRFGFPSPYVLLKTCLIGFGKNVRIL